MQICRIRLWDKPPRLPPRRAPPKPCEAYEPEVPVKVREGITPALASPDLVLELEPPAQPHSRVVVERAIGFAGGADTEVIGPPAKRAVQHVDELWVSCQLRARSVSAWTLSTMRLMLFFDGRWPKRALPVVGEYIRPNVYPRKSNSPSGTLQIRVFSSFTASFSLPMIWRRWCRAISALPLRHRITRSSA